ncbi:RICIN domain-containing protein [Flavicella sediminum]|uniref:RICIN domain-containing protein n=1 Tax=Flavicella sediminum TaxID=2585141 RepID=UPI0011221C1F|nr:RICIN domain-containing protein [Flavicella sediminum]
MKHLSYCLLTVFVFLTYSCSTIEEIENELETEQSSIDETVLDPKSKKRNFKAPTSTGHHYVENLEYVLGDVKQAQITNAYTNTTIIDNALDGFEEMGVNGIRIAIFADNVNPNETMYDYFYTQAKARGFKIFANPAQGSGGARIANGILNGTVASVKNSTATNALITRIKAFAQQYSCDWINPFNEDSRPGTLWYAGQFNNIYSALYGQVNGAELIGSCDWGIEAGILSLQQTNIKNYISIASTHNLGFQHSLWPDYIAAAGSLPVWDSETNNNVKYTGVATRIDAAIAAGVDGIVLYNSWNTINNTTGELKSAGQDLKDKFTQYYYLKNKQSLKKIKPYSDVLENSLIVQVPNSWSGTFSQWEIVPTDNGYFRFRNRGSKMYFRPTNSNDYSDIYSVSSFSGSGTHVQWKTVTASDGYLFIQNRATGKNIRSRNDDDIDINNSESAIKINQAPTSWTGDRTKWELIKAN